MAASTKANDTIEHQPPPNFKTWVIKTSIHCNGCKKKIIKILHSTPGVYDSDVDLKLQKITVRGNIDVQGLVAKLIKKTGKHAELCLEIKTEQQQPPHSTPKPKPKPKTKPKPQLDSVIAEEQVKKNEDDQVNKEKPNAKTSKDAPKENVESSASKAAPTQQKNDEQVKNPIEKKAEEDVSGKGSAEVSQTTEVEKQNAAVDGGAANEKEDGIVDKKKKKKGHNSKQLPEKPREGQESSPDATATNERSFQYYSPNDSPTRQYPGHMYGTTSPSYHPPPVYTVNYNTTPYPTSSYGASYYAMPPPHTEAYAYSSASSNAEYQPLDHVSDQPHSFNIFSDENPNACSLM